MKRLGLYIIISFFLFPVCMAQTGNTADSAVKTEELIRDSALYRFGFKNLFSKGAFDNSFPYDGQMHPGAYAFAKDYIAKHRKNLERIKKEGQPYFMLIENVLTQYRLPKELKYLAVIESNLNAYAISWAGAVGPWQFMPETGRRYGLRVDHWVDERRNYYRSTQAAAFYLAKLYRQFNDWLLVIAAYNGGEGRVESAIRKSGSRDFWKLQYLLPEESRNHVKKFIATHYIMEGKGGETTIVGGSNPFAADANSIKLTDDELKNTASERIVGKYHSLIITKTLMMDVLQFNRLNPDFDKMIASNSQFDIRLPKDKMELFKAKRNDILNESVYYLLSNPPANTANYPPELQLPPAKKSKSN